MPEIPSDGELMARYAAGNAEAFRELFGRYEGRAWRYLRRRVGSDALAQDLYQELFLRLHRFRSRYDPERPFAPWFFQIARHVVADEFRRSGRSPERGNARGTVDPEQPPEAERTAAAREAVRHHLASLSPEQADVLVAAKLEGLAYAEIALRLGKTVAAVKQTASRAMRRLRLAGVPPA